ncbi:SDR family NAD(P)-dependent oxidoreductase [Adhaeretor mobilis]|uniref:3-oxoacyl-[acyl-carrier-protein] reductase FabG n=1 Tax=Adhaeretor mobilis TaxID=1930276 RepID=A0A517MQ26_9BACT|nr:SDR family oxidoreductase [Adhaeretor mobilis]QDS96887.1 3-oxoacyl-[acyl-carrier-protein] reductase FabG [Adhaeretor mobilis]
MSTQSKNARAFIVLGASGGIGAQVASQLSAAGHELMLASRKSDRLDDLARELKASKRELDAVKCDEVQACFEAASQKFGRIDGAVNCVGSLLLKPAHLTRESEWHETINTNLTSAFATVRAAAKTMTSMGGSVVLLSSAAAKVGLANHEAIAAAKAGVVGLARSAAASYAGRSLRFNVVAPGLVKTELTKKIWENERAAASSTAMHPLGRLGKPEEVASLIAWLLDPANSWVTGEVFSIDGGLGNIQGNQRATRG